MKTSEVLMIGGVSFLAYQVIKGQSQEQGGGFSDLLGGLGGGSGMPDLTGLFSGIGEMISGIVGQGGGGQGGGEGGGLLPDVTGITEYFRNLFGGGGGGGGGGIGLPDVTSLVDYFRNIFAGGGDGGGGGGNGGGDAGGGQGRGDWWTTPIITKQGGVVDWGNAISQTAMSLAKAGVTSLGVYAGYKVAVPVLSKVAPAIGTPLANLAKVGGNFGVNVAKGGANLITKLGGGSMAYLTTPLTSLGVTGAIGAVPLVAGAGYGGYKLGELLMNKTPLGKWTGTLAETAAVNVFKTPVIGQMLFPHAEVKKMTTTTQSNFQKRWGITATQAKGMTTAQLQAIIKKKPVNKPIVKTTAAPYNPGLSDMYFMSRYGGY